MPSTRSNPPVTSIPKFSRAERRRPGDWGYIVRGYRSCRRPGSSVPSSEAAFHHPRFRFSRRSESSFAFHGRNTGTPQHVFVSKVHPRLRDAACAQGDFGSAWNPFAETNLQRRDKCPAGLCNVLKTKQQEKPSRDICPVSALARPGVPGHYGLGSSSCLFAFRTDRQPQSSPKL